MKRAYKGFFSNKGASVVEYSFLAAAFSFMLLVGFNSDYALGVGRPFSKAGYKTLRAGGTEGTGETVNVYQTPPAPNPTASTPTNGLTIPNASAK